jgi:SanA protein
MRSWCARLASLLALLAGGVMLAGVAFLLLANWWVHDKDRRSRSFEALSDVPARDFAIVPGIGDHDGAIRDRLRGRLLAGLTLYRAHKVRRILMSGIGVRPRPGDEVTTSRVWLMAHGVKPEDIVIDRSGYRTLDTMQRAAKVFGVKSAVVCTQAQHIDRSVFLAQAAGIDAVGFRADMHDILGNFEIRFETMKAALAFADTYLLHRGPRDPDPPAASSPAGTIASAP